MPRAYILVLFCLLTLVGVSIALGQATRTGTFRLKVTVFNDKGDPVVGAHVNASRSAGLSAANGVTDASGTAILTVSRSGHYEVTVETENYATGSDSVDLTADGETVEVPIVLDHALKSTVTVKVRVTDPDGHPIDGAACVMSGLPTSKESTDSQGEATFRFTNSSRFTNGRQITVSKLGFLSETQSVEPNSGGTDQSFNLNFVLKRSVHDGVVIIHVVEEGTRQPLEGASIRMVGSKPSQTPLGPRPDVVTGKTDGSGKCQIYGDANHFVVTASHTGYASGSSEIDLGDRGTQEITIELKPKASRAMARMLRVHVVGKTAGGKLVPLEDASVTTSFGGSGTTNASGDDFWLHEEPPGETITVSAIPQNKRFKKGSNSVIVNARGSLFDMGKKAGWEELGFTDADVERFSDLVTRAHHAEMSGKLYNAYNSLTGAHGIDYVTITCQETSGEPLHGDLILNHGRVKTGETVNLDFALLYEHGSRGSVSVNEKVMLYGPDGALISTDAKQRTLKLDAFSRRSLNFTPEKPGTYTVRATAGGTGVAEWHDEVKFAVTHDASGWVLVQKVPRQAYPGETVTASSYANTDQGVGGYRVTYSAPPEVMELGKSYILTATNSNPNAHYGKWTCPAAEAEPLLGLGWSSGDGPHQYKITISKPPVWEPGRKHVLVLFTMGQGPPACQFVYEWRSK